MGRQQARYWGSFGTQAFFLLFVALPCRGSRLEWQHGRCPPSPSRLPPTEQRGSKALVGRERPSRQWNQKLLLSGTRNSFFLPALGLTEPCPPPDLVGRRGSRGWGHTIWNRFGMEDLRFKGIIFFCSTTVFQVGSHVDLPYHKIDKKNC